MRQRKFNPIKKAKENPKSFRKAHDAMCADCQCWEGNSSWRWLIGNCDCTDGPLHVKRPYQQKKGKPTPRDYRSAGDSDSGE